MNSRDMICDEEMDEAEQEHSCEVNQEEAQQRLLSLQADNMEEDDDPVAAMLREGSQAPWRDASLPTPGKKPFAAWQWEDQLEANEVPDLADYFSQFLGLQEVSQIAICRTYANYLAAKRKRLTPPTKRARK